MPVPLAPADQRAVVAKAVAGDRSRRMIAVVVPVLSRPGNAQPLVDSFYLSTVGEASLTFVVSPDDDEQISAVIATGADMISTDWLPGHADFAHKVNLAYRHTDAEWLFQGADDIEFTPGWDTAALAVAEATGAKVIGTNDAANPTVKAGRHSTHSLIARDYIDDPGASMDGPGTVFSTAYAHAYCDNELVEVAKARGVWAFASESVVKHRHWVWGTAEKDATYEKGAASFRQDGRVFQRRRRLWTGRPTRV